MCVGIDLSFSIAMVPIQSVSVSSAGHTNTYTDRMAVRNVNDKVSYNSMASNVEHICGMRLDKDRSHQMKRMMVAMMEMKNDNEDDDDDGSGGGSSSVRFKSHAPT